MKLFYLALLWSLWCALHSLLISVRVVTTLEAVLGDRFRYYRVFFNTVSVLTLIPVLIYSHSLRGDLLFKWAGAWRPVQLGLAVSALVLFYAGGRHYDLMQFLGIRQVSEHESAKGLTETGTLDTSGILSLIRHPWYTAAILIIWARSLDRAAIITNSVLTCYLVIGTILEERKLVAEFGEEYRDYQKRVPMFFPGYKGKSGKVKG